MKPHFILLGEANNKVSSMQSNPTHQISGIEAVFPPNYSQRCDGALVFRQDVFADKASHTVSH